MVLVISDLFHKEFDASAVLTLGFWSKLLLWAFSICISALFIVVV